MSAAPVDVLAVMDAEIDGAVADRQALCQARVEVSELIESAQRVLDKYWEYGQEQTHFSRLDAAIAKAKGEQP